jgi:hypothetical protein
MSNESILVWLLLENQGAGKAKKIIISAYICFFPLTLPGAA